MAVVDSFYQRLSFSYEGFGEMYQRGVAFTLNKIIQQRHTISFSAKFVPRISTSFNVSHVIFSNAQFCGDEHMEFLSYGTS